VAPGLRWRNHQRWFHGISDWWFHVSISSISLLINGGIIGIVIGILVGGLEHVYSSIYWEESSQLALFYSRGVGIPPTRYCWGCSWGNSGIWWDIVGYAWGYSGI